MYFYPLEIQKNKKQLNKFWLKIFSVAVIPQKYCTFCVLNKLQWSLFYKYFTHQNKTITNIFIKNINNLIKALRH